MEYKLLAPLIIIALSAWVVISLVIYANTFGRFYDVTIFGVRVNECEGIFLVILWPIMPIIGLVYFIVKLIRGK